MKGISGLTILITIILGIIFLLVILSILGQLNENICNICMWICKPIANFINKLIPIFNPISCKSCGAC
jgi:uncharacterized protein YggT (Ycf19 family)